MPFGAKEQIRKSCVSADDVSITFCHCVLEWKRATLSERDISRQPSHGIKVLQHCLPSFVGADVFYLHAADRGGLLGAVLVGEFVVRGRPSGEILGGGVRACSLSATIVCSCISDPVQDSEIIVEYA